jgi:hypothetical protein
MHFRYDLQSRIDKESCHVRRSKGLQSFRVMVRLGRLTRVFGPAGPGFGDRRQSRLRQRSSFGGEQTAGKEGYAERRVTTYHRR